MLAHICLYISLIQSYALVCAVIYGIPYLPLSSLTIQPEQNVGAEASDLGLHCLSLAQ